MEIEVNWRRLFLIIGIIALVILAAVFVPRFMNRSPVQATEAVATVTPTPAHQKVVANVDITLDNRSEWKIEGWDECLPMLSAWIGEQYPLQSLTVVVTDTVSPDMVLGVSQTGGDEHKATVYGKYEEKDDQGLNLTVAIKQGEPGNNLDTAMTVEIAWLVQEFYRPKTKESWQKSQHEGLEIFQPLIHKENDQWVSDCLHLTR